MHHVRPVFAEHPMRFGRGPMRTGVDAVAHASSIPGDIKLFAATFVAGFLFVSIMIG